METSKSLSPLTPAVFYILLALAGGEKHGYEVMKRVKQDSGGQVKMGTGTLYGSLKRMLADGLIEEAGERPDPALDDERRRYYRLTELGRQALGAELQRYARVASLAVQRRLLPPIAFEPTWEDDMGDDMRRAEHQGGHRATSPDKQSATQHRSAARAYALLLRLYPRAHRQAFGQQMLQTFQDHYRDVVETHEESALCYWHDVLGDVGRSLVREYWLTWRMAVSERTRSMKSGGSAVLAVVAGLLLLLGLRVWLSPALLRAPHGGGAALSSVVGLALLLLIYGLLALGLLRAHLGTGGPRRSVTATALRRATCVGALLGSGALVAIAVATLGDFESSISLAVWGLVVVAAPLGWGVAGLLAARAGGSWRLGVVAGLWSGMVSALVGAVGEVASTLLALPRLVQHELSNPDYLAWHQPDVQSYAIASALAVGMIGLILAPVVADIAGSIGSGIGKSSRAVALPDEANLR